ncbi:MAG: PIN domain-containing protein [Methanothrix sp.]|nr:PIN domain-containing protein [Methanothrix sp.]
MGLKLSDLPEGENIFLDANIFLYSAFDHPTFGVPCRDFLARVDREELHGYSSGFVLNEVFHKLMISEIIDTFDVKAQYAKRLFKERPEILDELNDVWEEMDIINGFHIVILDAQTFPEFVQLSKRFHLMAMDSAHLAIMKLNGLTNLATNDADFERIPYLKVWKP